MEKKRVLVLGASILQKPLIEKVKEKGCYLGVADYNPNASGVREADEFYCVSTIDEKGIYEAAKRFQADAIVTMATDMPMRAIAYASEKLGLKSISYETALKATDKELMIKALEKNHIAHPKYVALGKEDVSFYLDRITYPCITKPTDSSGSRGVHLVQSKDELMESVRYSFECSRRGRVIVEEYMIGQEISVEMLCQEGKAYVLAITEKMTTGAPYFVEIGHNEPARFDDKLTSEIEGAAKNACKAIGICDGAAHVEMIVTKDGPKIVELGARMGGDFITSDLVPLSTGIDMVWLMVLIALGEKPLIGSPAKRGAAIRYFKVKPGKLNGIKGIEQARNIEGVLNVEINVSPGDMIPEVKSSSDRIGQVIAIGEHVDEAAKRAEQALELVKFEVNEYEE